MAPPVTTTAATAASASSSAAVASARGRLSGIGGGTSSSINRKRKPGTAIGVGSATSSLKVPGKRIHVGVDGVSSNTASSNSFNSNNTEQQLTETDDTTIAGSNANYNEVLKNKFLKIFDEPDYKDGIPNSILKERFVNNFQNLVPVINELMGSSRISMSKDTRGELYYTLISETIATKLNGLDAGTRMVYQIIQKADNMGIWTKTIRTQTNIEQQTLNKIFKTLETRKLIKPVKSVNAKSKKLYMLYEITPSKELTGGVWYSDLEFDHEFISELRTFIIKCIRHLNNGKGVTVKQILEKMIQAKICKVELSTQEVQQLIETLIYDYIVEEVTDNSYTTEGGGDSNSMYYVAARRVTPMCEFKWWDEVLSVSDFKYRTIKFNDSVSLAPHEPHYHTA